MNLTNILSGLIVRETYTSVLSWPPFGKNTFFGIITLN